MQAAAEIAQHKNSENSVYFLIKALCRVFVKQHHEKLRRIKQCHSYEPILNNIFLDEASIEIDVSKLKAKSFEILLHKGKTVERAEDDYETVERNLLILLFSIKLKYRGNIEICEKIDKYEQPLCDAFANDPYFTKGPGLNMIKLLIALHRDYGTPPTHITEHLLVPGPFTLNANFHQNCCYPTNALKYLSNEKPKYFKGVAESDSHNPYLPKFIHSNVEQNFLFEHIQKFSPQLPIDLESQCTFTGITKSLWCKSMRIDVRSYHLFSNDKKFDKLFEHQYHEEIRHRKSQIFRKGRKQQKKNLIFTWNWENFGNVGVTKAKPFCSESKYTLDLQCIHSQSIGRIFLAKIMTFENFMRDLKALTVGIQSDTFYFDDKKNFQMIPDITVEHLLPGTIRDYVVNFLECGTCYKRLKMLINNEYYQFYNGFIYKALCNALDEYLVTFREFVYARENETLIRYHERVKNVMNQISFLTRILKIHPTVIENSRIPLGSKFLSYLYKHILTVSKTDMIALLMFFFKRCCHVYFKYLQKWIFYGVLDDPCKELFITHITHYRHNTKSFYDKAYIVNKDEVPKFFHNFEEKILLCGKYTMLLKAFKPNHTLFSLDYPLLSVCLDMKDIETLNKNCANYSANALIKCGNVVSISSIYKIQIEEKHSRYEIMSKRSKESIEKWAVEQRDKSLRNMERKRERLRELSEQLKLIREYKVAQKRSNIEYELKVLEEAEKIDIERMQNENKDLKKRLQYYQDMKNMICQTTNEDNSSNISKSLSLSPSTAGNTEFDSCIGDEDEILRAIDLIENDDRDSNYEECFSADFLEEFKKTDKTLDDMSNLNENVIHNTNIGKETNIIVFEKNGNINERINDTASMYYTPRSLNRSVSDIINSNDLPEFVESDLKKNRYKALSSLNVGGCVKYCDDMKLLQPTKSTKEMMIKKIIDCTDIVENDLMELRICCDSSSTATSALTAAQSNKIKILYNSPRWSYQDDVSSETDINSNKLLETDLHRNRQRMMHDDIFASYNKDPLADRPKLNLNLDSDRSRNRFKVLSSEYHMFTGEKITSNNLLKIDDVATPMSTTSDSIILIEPSATDLENGNVSVPSLNELKLQISSITSNTDPLSSDRIDSAKTNDTLKKDFDFTDNKRIRKNDLPIAGDDNTINLYPTIDYTKPYKRCEDLIKSNFKCPQLCHLFRMNTTKVKDTELQLLTVDSMTVFSLTDYIKKSLTIPMTAHLKIVNNEVMRMLLNELKLLEHFRSLRQSFFMMDGEFAVKICENIIGCLEGGATPTQLFNYQLLHTLLENALNTSIMGTNKYAEYFSFSVDKMPEKFDLKSSDVLSNLNLIYRIKWPLSLILTQEALEKYSLIFKYLLKVRRISWILERSFLLLSEILKVNGVKILRSPQYRHIQYIRHKIYQFIHALQNHITANAMQASWKKFKDELIGAKALEDIYRMHTLYLKRILFLCMLNKRSVEFLNCIETIFKIALRFYYNLQKCTFVLKPCEEYYTHERYESMKKDEIQYDKFVKYTIYLGNKIVRHGYQAEIGYFIELLNHNLHYMPAQAD